MKHITARTCPLDPETGEFQSAVAEAGYREMLEQGGDLNREQFRIVMQAINAAEDRSRMEYEKHKAERIAAESSVSAAPTS